MLIASDVFAVMCRHHLHLPSNLALLLKTVIMIEGLGVNLDPQFHLTAALEPYADRLVMRKYSPSRLARNLGQVSLDLALTSRVEMRFQSKQEFVKSVEKEHETLVDLLRSVPRSRYREAGVWGDGWTIQDLLAHLTAWEQMFLGWYRVGHDGGHPVLPARGFKWNETPRLNRAIWTKHRFKSVDEVIEESKASYQEILCVIRQLSEEELLTPGHFAWTGRYPLTTYLAPNTCSHYRFALKILKRWLKSKGQLKKWDNPD
jgi:hypothetical protein